MMTGRHLRIVTLALLVQTLASCASSNNLAKIQAGGLPEDLPKDMQAKFEVREVTADAPAVAPSPTPAAVVMEKKLTAAEIRAAKRKERQEKAAAAKLAAKAAKEAKAAAGEPVAKDEKAPGSFSWVNRRPAKDPIWLGEKQIFELTYFGMVAGDFSLEALPYKEMNGRKVYHIKGTAISSRVFSLFYKLNDTVESYIDYDGIFSHRFQIDLNETKQTRLSIELNDSEKGTTFYWNRWNHYQKGYTETKETKPIQPFSQDSVSALFYLRTLPLKTGATYTFPVISEGKTWEAVATVLRREPCASPVGKIQCIVVKPETKYQGILQKRGDSFFWLSDDDRRMLVRLEAKVRIGTVVAYLKGFEPGTPPSAEAGASK